MELMRASELPKPVRQANLARSRQGVIRALHYHERGQDDLFLCLQGMVRVVVLDRETRRDVHRGHRRRQPGRDLRPRHATRTATRRSPTASSVTSSPRSTTPPTRTSTACRGTTRASSHLWSTRSPILSARDAAARVPRSPAPAASSGTRSPRRFPDGARADARRVGRHASAAGRARARELVLHAAAWTDVDGAEDDPQDAAAVNVGGVQHAAALGAPLVVWSTDYVFDGAKREPYVESDAPCPLGAYGRTKLHGEAAAGEQAWIVRTLVALRPDRRTNFVRTMLRLGAERDEVAVVDDQRGSPDLRRPSRRGDEAGRSSCRTASTTSPRAGDCTWADFAEAIFEEAGLDDARPPDHDRRVRRARRRAPRTRCCAARRARPSCRTGARGCASASGDSAQLPDSPLDLHGIAAGDAAVVDLHPACTG